MPSLGSVLPRWKPSRVVSIMNAVMPRAPLSGVGHGEQHDVLGHRAGGDPALLAVDHVAAVGLLHGAAAHRGGVGTGLRLGQRERADLAAFGDRAHVLLLLRLGAEGQDAVAEQRVVHRHDGRCARRRPRRSRPSPARRPIGSMPAPPYSAGTSMPIRPFSPRARMFSSGNSPVRSWCSALGAIFSRAMRRATSWSISCSSVNPKSTTAP